jgi:hypothetical protein
MTEFLLRPQTARFVRLATGLLVAASTFAVSASLAHARAESRQNYRDARGFIYHQRASNSGRRQAPFSSDPTFSEIVNDAKPASITKVMTLYLLFEQIDKGALTLQSQIPI